MNNTQEEEYVFRTDSLCKFYPQTKTFALREASLNVAKGEFLAIRGPSGSGKSTLLYLLGGLLGPTSGEIFFHEKQLAKIRNKSAYRRDNIGFVFQDFYLYPRFSVLENVLFPCMHKFVVPGSIIKQAEKQLEYLHMLDKKNMPVEVLSAGERQRACIARALLFKPQCILADEPTGNLDSQNAKNIMGMLKKLNEEFKTTVIVVTHDDMVSGYAHRIVHIIDGKLQY